MASILLPVRDPRPAGTAGRTGILDGAVAALRRCVVLLARLVAWFAADPQRVRAAAAALAVCVAVGAVVGVGVGLLLDGLVSLVLALVTGP